MARTTNADPIEKFRFQVTVLNISVTPVALAQNFIQTAHTFLRTGFNSVKLPDKSTKELTYRESGDPLHLQKQPGLTTYSDCILRRGSTENQDFYRWSLLVKGDSQFKAISAEIAGITTDKSQYPSSDALNYRKDMIIDVLGRDGSIKKSWYLYNCWVKAFNPGELNAQEEQQLIEEIILACEIMSEVSADQAEKNRIVLSELGSATLNSLVPGLGAELQGGF